MANPPPFDPSSVPLFGRCALEEGHLDEEQVGSLLKEHLDTTDDDGSVTFANLCLKKKLLTPVLVQNILLVQNYRELRMEDEGMASIAVQRGMADEEVVRFALEAQSKEFVAERKLPRRLCPVLIEAEVLTEQDAALLQAEWSRLRKASRAAAPRAASRPDAAVPAAPEPKPPARTLGWLVVEFGDAIGRRIPVGESAVLGRAPFGDVPIHDPRISRQHVRIEIDPAMEDAFITDLGSKNGTFLNQAKLEGRQPLKPGALIRLGMSVLRFKPASEPLSVKVPAVGEPSPPVAKPPDAQPAPSAATRTGGPATEPLPGTPGDDPPELTEGRDVTLPLIG